MPGILERSFLCVQNIQLELFLAPHAFDLIRIADQMFKNNMQFAQITVIDDMDQDDYDGLVRISAIPSIDSDDVTTYPEIKGKLTVEIDDDLLF